MIRNLAILIFLSVPAGILGQSDSKVGIEFIDIDERLQVDLNTIQFNLALNDSIIPLTIEISDKGTIDEYYHLLIPKLQLDSNTKVDLEFRYEGSYISYDLSSFKSGDSLRIHRHTFFICDIGSKSRFRKFQNKWYLKTVENEFVTSLDDDHFPEYILMYMLGSLERWRITELRITNERHLTKPKRH